MNEPTRCLGDWGMHTDGLTFLELEPNGEANQDDVL